MFYHGNLERKLRKISWILSNNAYVELSLYNTIHNTVHSYGPQTKHCKGTALYFESYRDIFKLSTRFTTGHLVLSILSTGVCPNWALNTLANYAN